MGRERAGPALLTILVLLVALLYPTLFMSRELAPEAALRAAPPWRQQWGPRTRPSPLLVDAARELGPRLAAIARDGVEVALWNPLIGGGREGWLGLPREGGAPLSLAAALLARPGRAWTALVTLELLASFAGAVLVLRRLGVSGWGGAVGGIAFALSGAAASSWLQYQGSAVALAPLVLLPAMIGDARAGWRTAAWGLAVPVAVASGPGALAVLAAAAAAEVILHHGSEGAGRRRLLAVTGVLAGTLVATPMLWTRAHAGEGGAAPSPLVSAPLPGPRALVVPFPEGDPAEQPAIATRWRQPSAQGVGYVGWVPLALAAIGVTALPRRPRALVLGLLLVAAALAFLPTDVLAGRAWTGRPFALLALAVALLAGAGASGVLDRVHPSLRGWMGALLASVVALSLFPAAAHRLPMAARAEAQLAAPIDAAILGDGSRVLALLDAMPADVGAALAIADVRAASLRLEPIYARLLGASANGEVGIPRALDPALARLGARWILEPLPLRLVSGEVFSRLELVERAVVAHDARVARIAVVVPAGATRLGLPAGARGKVWLRRGGHARILDEDATLVGESEQWRWLAVPDGWEEGAAVVEVADEATRRLEHMPLAWDRSGLRVAAESNELRVWEWRQAAPFASLVAADNAGPAGTVRVTARRPGRLAVEVEATAAARLEVQLKYRPALWHATVDGRSVASEPCDQVWTAVPVPAGRSSVVLEAALPRWVWAAPLLGVVVLGAVALARRTQ